jgi:talin
MSIHEVIAEIREKANMGGADHGIFQPAQAGNPKARWLRSDKTLRFYDIQSGMDIEYKKKHRQIKVKLLDDTQKVILVDESSTVAEITLVIADKLSIKNPEEFSIKLEGGSLWLNPTLSLTEQGVDEMSVLVFKKKFFFNDANVDKSDPIQLHLLYIQMKGAIVGGDHPVSKDEARDLASIQLQIQGGDFDPNKHKPGSTYVVMEEIVAPMYQKVKGLDREIIAEYRKLVGMTAENAKYRYVQLCRSLKSYGTTFFEVKELINKKPVPRILGITRNNIYRLDATTREIIKDHDITHLKRWSASPTQFLMDFGEFETDYVRLQTPESETISQIIAGYIDIILKVRKDGGVVLEEEDGEEAVIESVSAISGIATSSTTTGMVSGGFDESMGQYGMMGGMGQMAGRFGPQGMMGMLLNPTDSLSCLAAARSLLDQFNNPDLAKVDVEGLSLDQWKQQLGSNMAQLMAAASALIEAAESGKSLKDMDPLAKNLFSSLKDMIGAARAAAVLSGDDVSLLDGAKAVSDAIAKVMQASMELARNPNDPAAQEALRAAKMALQNATTFLNAASAGMIADGPSQSLLAEAAKLVAASVTHLVGESARVGKDLNSSEVLEACRTSGVAANRLVVTSSAVAPAITSGAVRAEVEKLAFSLSDANALLITALANAGTDANTMNMLRDAATAVSNAITQLMDATMCASAMGSEPQDFVTPIVTIRDRVEDLDQNARTQPKVIGPDTRDIAGAVTQLVNAAKNTARHADKDTRTKLLEASKAVIDALAKLQESSKKAQANPRDIFTMQQLEASAEAVEAAAQAVLSSAGDRCVMDSVRYWAKVVAATMAGNIAASNAAALRSDEETRQQLIGASLIAGKALTQLVTALKDSTQHPDDKNASSQLVAQCKQAAHPGAKLVATSKGSIPKIDDVTRKTQLNSAADDLQKALGQMMAAIKAGADKGPSKEVNEALAQLTYVGADLDAVMFAADTGALPRPVGVDVEQALQSLTIACRRLQEQVPPLRNAAHSCPEDVGPAAKDTSGSMYGVVGEAKTVAACAADPKTQKRIILATKAVVASGSQLIEQSMAASHLPDNPVLQMGVDEAADELNANVVALLNAARGLDTRELDDATAVLVNQYDRLNYKHLGASGADWSKITEDLLTRAREYMATVASVSTKAEQDTGGLVAAAKLCAEASGPFVTAANNAASHCPDEKVSTHIMTHSKDMMVNGARVVEDAKIHATTQDAASKKLLADHLRSTKDALQALIDALGSAQPGYRDVTDSIQKLVRILSGVDSGSGFPTRSLQHLVEACKSLGETTSTMVSVSRTTPAKLGEQSQLAVTSLNVVSDAAQSVSKQSGGKGVTIPTGFEEHCRALLNTVNTIEGSRGNPEVEIDGAKNLARGTIDVVECARKYAMNVQDPEQRRNAIYATEKLALATTAVSKGVRNGVTQDQLVNVRAAISDLISAVIVSDESPAAKLMVATRMLFDTTSEVLSAASAVVANPKDSRTQNKMSSSAQSMPDAIQAVVNAATALTPGVKECDSAIEMTENAIGEIDSATIAATFGQLESSSGRTHQECQKELVAVSKSLSVDVASLAAGDLSKLAALSVQAGTDVTNFADIIQNAAATTSNRDVQADLLSNSKHLCEALLGLLNANRALAAGTGSAAEVKERAMATNKAIASLASSLKTGVVSLRELDEAIAKIAAMEGEFAQPAQTEKSYQRAQNELKSSCQSLVQDLSSLVSNAKTNVEELGATAKVLATKIAAVTLAAREAATTTSDTKARAGLSSHGQACVAATAEIVRKARDVANDPKNRANQQKLQQSFAGVSQAVTALLDASYAGATGERECDEATASLGRVLADLDAASLFAAAGQLNIAELSRGRNYEGAYKDATARLSELENISKTFADKALKDQLALGSQAKEVARLGKELAEDIKAVGALGGDKQLQQQMYDAVKEVERHAQAMLNNAKEAVVNGADEMAGAVVSREVEHVTEALKELRTTIDRAANESARGIMEIDKASDAVRKDVNRYPNADYKGNPNADALEVVKYARLVATATGELVSGAGLSQDDLVKGVQLTAESVIGLLAASKGGAQTSSDLEVRRKVDGSAIQTAEAALKLLEAAKNASKNSSNMQAQAELSRAARECADGLQEVVSSANRLPGGEGLTLEEDTGDDIEEAAERELRACAEAIEKAAATISNRGQLDSGMDDQLKEVTGAILDAARAIAGATAMLVTSAHGAQKERVEKGKNPKTKHLYRKDPKWANGLISAAQTVAATTRHLVQQANQASKGQADEEVLVASARAVAAATAQLVSASAAKADNPNSKSQVALKAAAKAVANATAKLVEAAKNAGKSSSSSNSDMELSTGAKAEFEQNVLILKLEKELEQARMKLAAMRKAAYTKK